MIFSFEGTSIGLSHTLSFNQLVIRTDVYKNHSKSHRFVIFMYIDFIEKFHWVIYIMIIIQCTIQSAAKISFFLSIFFFQSRRQFYCLFIKWEDDNNKLLHGMQEEINSYFDTLWIAREKLSKGLH